MENGFDYDKIDLDKVPEKDRPWILIFLLLFLDKEKEPEKAEEIKKKIEEMLNKQ